MAARGSRGRHYNWIPPTSQKDLFDEDDCHLVFLQRNFVTLQALVSAKRKKNHIPLCLWWTSRCLSLFPSSLLKSSSSIHYLVIFLSHSFSLTHIFYFSLWTLSSLYFHSLSLLIFHAFFFLSLSLGVSLFFLSHYFSSFRSFIHKKLAAPQLILLCVIAILFAQ